MRSSLQETCRLTCRLPSLGSSSGSAGGCASEMDSSEPKEVDMASASETAMPLPAEDGLLAAEVAPWWKMLWATCGSESDKPQKKGSQEQGNDPGKHLAVCVKFLKVHTSVRAMAQ